MNSFQKQLKYIYIYKFKEHSLLITKINVMLVMVCLWHCTLDKIWFFTALFSTIHKLYSPNLTIYKGMKILTGWSHTNWFVIYLQVKWFSKIFHNTKRHPIITWNVIFFYTFIQFRGDATKFLQMYVDRKVFLNSLNTIIFKDMIFQMFIYI